MSFGLIHKFEEEIYEEQLQIEDRVGLESGHADSYTSSYLAQNSHLDDLTSIMSCKSATAPIPAPGETLSEAPWDKFDLLNYLLEDSTTLDPLDEALQELLMAPPDVKLSSSLESNPSPISEMRHHDCVWAGLCRHEEHGDADHLVTPPSSPTFDICGSSLDNDNCGGDVKKRILKLFNNASLEELASLPGFSKRKAEFVLKARPFIMWDEISEKLERSVASSAIRGAEEMFRIRDDVTELMQRCTNLLLISRPSAEQESSLRRMENVHNELGVHYMSQANVCVSKNGLQSGEYNTLVKKSLNELESGIAAFEKVADSNNLALMLTNTGKLMRLCSHIMSSTNKNPFAGQEKHYYNKALSYYRRALFCLGTRSKKNVEYWDSVNWELSTTYYNMAVLLQDFPDETSKYQSIEELEKEVAEHLHKALKSCDLTTIGSKQPMYQFRAASIHHRLATFYHRSLRNMADVHKKKLTLQLCKLNYDKSAEIFRSLDKVAEFLKVQLQRVALAEFSADNSNGLNRKKLHLIGAVDLILGSEDVLKVISTRHKDTATEEEEGSKLVLLMEQRLQCILLSLAKLATKMKASPAIRSQFKSSYAATLQMPENTKGDLKSEASRLLLIIQKVALNMKAN